MKKIFLILAVLVILPLTAHAQAAGDGEGAAGPTDPATTSSDPFQFQRQGVFDCNQNGAYAMSVGALSAIGGAYVPVADATVELNTGILVYKECVLREVVNRTSERALTALQKQQTVSVLTGRGGNALFVQQPPSVEAVLNASDPALLNVLQTAQQKNVEPAIIRTVAQVYEAETRSPFNALDCPFQGDRNAFYSGQPGTFDLGGLWRSADPSCYPIGRAGILQAIATNYVSQANSDIYQQWQWGRGYYPRVDANGNVVTPAVNIQEGYQQILDTGVQKLVNANDIGQIVGALYAGLSTQIIGDINGLAGITKSAGSQPSYLDRLAAESAAGLRGAANNAALQILAAAQQVESAYYQAVNAIGALLTQTRTQLRTAEAACWNQVIAKSCATPLAADNTCTASAGACTTDPTTGQQTCPTPIKLKVATSTAFSDAVIAAKITPLIQPTADAIQSSKTALDLINNLIKGITNTASTDAQRIALQQLDGLVGQRKLHTQTNLADVKQQQTAVGDTMSSTLQTTAQTWGGSGTDGTANIPWDGTTNPGNGWCNVNNSATIAAWQQAWKK